MSPVVENYEREKQLTAAERAYLDALFKEVYPKLHRVASRHLSKVCPDSVEDVIQETFLKACRQFHDMIQRDAPEAWLVSVCHNAAVDEVRRYKRICELFEHSAKYEIDSAASAIEEILPPGTSKTDREILFRHYVYKETSEEIGRTLGMKASNVRQRLARLREKIKKSEK